MAKKGNSYPRYTYSVTVDGHVGTYYEEDGMITVEWMHYTKSTYSSPAPEAFAKILMREMINEHFGKTGAWTNAASEPDPIVP